LNYTIGKQTLYMTCYSTNYDKYMYTENM